MCLTLGYYDKGLCTMPYNKKTAFRGVTMEIEMPIELHPTLIGCGFIYDGKESGISKFNFKIFFYMWKGYKIFLSIIKNVKI